MPPSPCPTYLTIWLRAPNVQAFTINLQRQYYHLSFFLYFFFFRETGRSNAVRAYKTHLNEIPRCINPTVSQCRRSPEFPFFLRGSSRRSPKRSPFTVGVCPLHDLKETKLPQAARAEPAGKSTRMDDSHCGHGPCAGRGRSGLDRRERRPGSGLMRTLFPTPTSGPG